MNLKAIKAYANMQRGEVLVVLVSKSDINEYVIKDKEPIVEDVALTLSAVAKLTELEMLDFKVLNIGERYTISQDTIQRVNHILTAGEEE